MSLRIQRDLGQVAVNTAPTGSRALTALGPALVILAIVEAEPHRRIAIVFLLLAACAIGFALRGIGLADKLCIDNSGLDVERCFLYMKWRRKFALSSVQSIAYRRRSHFRASALIVRLQTGRTLRLASHLRPYEAEQLLAALDAFGHNRLVEHTPLSSFIVSTPAAQ